MVRVPRIALGTPDWQTCTLLLRYTRIGNYPLPALAAGWLFGNPIGNCVLRSRIKNRRLFEQNGRLDGFRTRIPRLEGPGSCAVRRQGVIRAGAITSQQIKHCRFLARALKN